MEKEHNFIFQLPAKTVSELSSALDPGDAWEEIAFLMPSIQDIDIEACRKISAGEGHATETLLRIWGSKGYTILDLYRIFLRVRLIRCMQILFPFVDEQFHKYAQISPGPDECHSPGQNSIIRKSREVRKSAHDCLVKKDSIYSRKGFSSAENSAPAGPEPATASSSGASVAPSESNGALIGGLQNTLAVKYEDILAATDEFAAGNVLGKGGYGVVFKGTWKHTEVAIKRIQGKREGGGDERERRERMRQSLQELRTLAKFRHDNILSLYGYSLDGPEPCLVYQFMLNGSLEDRLLCRNGSTPLSWERKLQICKGVSCGLHFLHSIGTMPIIHGDVKSANILLDKHFEPKLGDFGLSRDGQAEVEGDERKPMIASHVKGTLAYLPPEFTTSRILTTKLDIYSFGVVLLEVATGQRAFSVSRNPQGLVEYALKICETVENGQHTETLMDVLADKRTPSTDSADSKATFQQFLSIGFACTKRDRFARPTSSDIFAKLKQLE